jgi:PAS domain S-box-containing protein
MLEKEEAEILRCVLDALDIGVYIVDRNSRVCFWNEAAELITGYSRAEVLGRCVTDDILQHFGLEPVNGDPVSALQATMKDGEPRRQTANIQHKHGHRISARIRTAPLKTLRGKLIGAVESLGELQAHPSAGPRDMTGNAARPLDGVKQQEQIHLSLQEACECATHENLHFGVLKIHLGQLTTLRKTHGREAANRLRELVVETLDSALCATDEVGIWSDSEFLVITSNQTARGLELDAGRLRSLLELITFRWWGDLLPISVAIGGVMAEETETPDRLLAAADEALRQSLLRAGNHITILDRWKDGGHLACSQSSAS